MKRNSTLFLTVIVVIGLLVRLVLLDIFPAGLNTDEASLGYNAYSLLLTAKDEYGKYFPIFFRSFGNFQSPLYVYLSIPFIYLFGLSAFSTRLLSALSGIFLIVITFFFLYRNWGKDRVKVALLSAFFIAISPWSIYFSRMALEANLGLMLFSMGVLFTTLVVKNPRYIIAASAVLALSTYAYHSERVVAFFFFFVSLFLLKKQFIENKRLFFASILIFIAIQIPQLVLIATPAWGRRFFEANYLSNNVFLAEGGELRNYFFGRVLFTAQRFISRYISYFSPKTLFSALDPKLSGAMPGLSIFYSWMIIPFFLGICRILREKRKLWTKLFLVMVILAPLPAALMREAFYALRTLPVFWGFTIITGIGMGELVNKPTAKFLKHVKYLVLIMVVFGSCLAFYTSYAVFFKYEFANSYNYPYIQLVKKANNDKKTVYMVDSARVPSLYILFALYGKVDPKVIQEQERSKKALGEYYTNININDNDVNLGNVITKISWRDSPCKKGIMVGDLLAMSDKQTKDHQLDEAFVITDLNGQVYLKAYSTNPNRERCQE